MQLSGECKLAAWNLSHFPTPVRPRSQVELSNKALEAEQKLVAAVRAEASAAREQAEAERAAKFVADAEAKALTEELSRVQEQMEKERMVARKVWMCVGGGMKGGCGGQSRYCGVQGQMEKERVVARKVGFWGGAGWG